MMRKIKKSDFYATGSCESAPLYFYVHTMAAARRCEGDVIVLIRNGIGEWFMERTKNVNDFARWLTTVPVANLEKRFVSWKMKWDAYNPRLYKYAKGKSANWLRDWIAIDKINAAVWYDPYTYRLELTDLLTDEIESEILKEMDLKKIPRRFFHELISPTEPTLTQKVAMDVQKIKSHKMSDEAYLKKFWFSGGSWNGGVLIGKKELTGKKKEKIVKIDFVARKKLQKSLEAKLDPRILNLVGNLRLLALWREERKVLVQKVNLAFKKVLEDGASELNLPFKTVIWARPDELGKLKREREFFENRKERSVYYYKFGAVKPVFLTGNDADKIFEEFTDVKDMRSLKGTVASKGVVKAKVRIILKEHQFDRFQKGEILVTTMTRPEFVPIMRKASAILTDEGGLTCHAAIISRELGIPCVVGTKLSTKVLKDGDLVEVDAKKGIVKIVK